jgi:hypothetical protein
VSVPSSKLGPPTPSPASECGPLSLEPKWGGGGRGDTLAFGGGMGGPNSDTGTETLVLYVYCTINPSAVATEGPCSKSTQSATPGFNHRLHNYIEAKATISHLKKLTCKGTLRHVFTCLGPLSPTRKLFGEV